MKMYLGRLLASALAVACVTALLADPEPVSTTDAVMTPMVYEAVAQAEKPVSLAQTSWSRDKVPFPGASRGSSSTVVRVVLTALLFLSAVFAYGGLPHLSAAPLISPELPRRLLQSISSDAVTSKSTQEAASRTVTSLRLRGMRHRLVRLDEGADGLLDDDRDSAKIQGFLSKATAYAQRQQFEKAAKLFKKGSDMAEDMLKDLKKDHAGQVELDDAQHQVSDALCKTAAFYLERGQAVAAKKTMHRVFPVIAGRTDGVAMRCRVLAVNVLRDLGEFDGAAPAYEDLLSKITEQGKTATVPGQAMLEEVAAEARGEYARTMLSQGKVAQARQMLEETLEKLPSSVSSALLAARLKGLLGFAQLKEGNPVKAIALLDASLAGFGELPAGLAGATAEIQEILQSRAMAKAAQGRLHSAGEDLEVVRGLQDELMKTITDEHNPKYAAGHGKSPDPRLWASMARTRAIAADLKLQAKSAAEALSLAKDARHLLREVKKSDGRLPKGYNLATFVEVKALIATARGQKSETLALPAGSEAPEISEESAHDTDTPTVLPETAEAAKTEDHKKMLAEDIVST